MLLSWITRWSAKCLMLAICLNNSTILSLANTEDLTQLGINGPQRTELIASLRAAGQEGLDKAIAARSSILFRQNNSYLYCASVPAEIADVDSNLLDHAIDEIAGQRYATLSQMYWYTDLDEAKAKAAAENKPILVLKLLGKLTDELSCANSRFFRTVLYVDPTISEQLRAKYVLYWSSVRPVPKITIDFGDGRTLERTITGNSAHYVITANGTIIDCLPGLNGPDTFRKWIDLCAELSSSIALQDPQTSIQELQRFHTESVLRTQNEMRAEAMDSSKSGSVSRILVPSNQTLLTNSDTVQSNPSAARALQTVESKRKAEASMISAIQPVVVSVAGVAQDRSIETPSEKSDSGEPFNEPKPTVTVPTAAAAGRLALSKGFVELAVIAKMDDSATNNENAIPVNGGSNDGVVQFCDSTLEIIRRETAIESESIGNAAQNSATSVRLAKVIENFKNSIAQDEVINAGFHATIHRWLAESATVDLESFNERVYSELFLTPSSDPWLGLASEDYYTGLTNGGLRINQ